MANHNPLDPLHAHRQIPAIDYELATAPDIQDDLKTKFGFGENIFFYNDLVEYSMNNSRKDIAEDLDVKSRYGLINNQPRESVGRAFRGQNGEHFPDHKFKELLGKVTNAYIAGIRKSQGGRKGSSMINPETGVRYVVEGARKSNEAQGKHVWSLEEIVDIHNFREDSIGKGYYKELPSLDYVRDKMNEKHGEDWSTGQIEKAYRSNKDKLSDEEE